MEEQSQLGTRPIGLNPLGARLVEKNIQNRINTNPSRIEDATVLSRLMRLEDTLEKYIEHNERRAQAQEERISFLSAQLGV